MLRLHRPEIVVHLRALMLGTTNQPGIDGLAHVPSRRLMAQDGLSRTFLLRDWTLSKCSRNTCHIHLEQLPFLIILKILFIDPGKPAESKGANYVTSLGPVAVSKQGNIVSATAIMGLLLRALEVDEKPRFLAYKQGLLRLNCSKQDCR